MKHLRTATKKAVVASALLAMTCATGNAFAADAAAESNPLQFYTGADKSFVKATIQTELAVFDQSNSWYGKAKENIGGESDSWFESTIRPGLEANFFIPSSMSLYGKVDAVQANTGGGLDAGGSNPGGGDVSDLRVVNALAGWKSGKLISGLDDDFLDVSFGRQQYIAGSGFLFWSEGGAGGERGAFWLGGRRSADYAGVVRMKTGGFSSDLIYLKADDLADSNTKAAGITVDYAFDKDKLAAVGGGIYNTTSDIQSRDGMNVFDVRGSVNPFALAGNVAALKPLKFEGEFVHEVKDDGYENANGWYLSTSYEFAVPTKPVLTYRYMSFDENYDALFYGFTDWGNFFQGEIQGEYALGNSNLDSHMVKLKFQPLEPVTINLIYYNFMLHDAAAAKVTSDKYADEYNFIVDYSVNEHLSFTFVAGLNDPKDGATQKTGGDEDWSYVMLYGCLKF